ncbi:DUF5667 domain-containing protein [Paenibacillus chondroitinus]|uniref:DUF5667 domain-containing protein n=1 Tax=Paenibacillus chondroitinus TaxID=59842 RepID=A0ABU6DAG0_9BACL|nr:MULTISPECIES: DUF5667 domain-containing protein [Paenibacillus]MCY9662264.1 DUF5667 domain-containing protein [Paenibacillus anseongense]MEB4794698.1 DUF5667 domain-containing protein [Paenibacillus chondroitinus]
MKIKFTKEAKRYSLLTKSVMLSMLVFSVGTSSVLASEIPAPTPSSTPISVNASQSTVDSTQSRTETLGLIPGDFFYFVKTIYENIQLALTVNDVKEARLLAAFAQERLAEANTLLAKGKTNEANLSLQKSLETQQSAIQKTEQASGLTTTETSTPAATASLSADADAEVTITADSGTEQTTESDQTDIEEVNVPEKEVKHPEQVLKVKTDLQHNILALASALEKVGNPKAQSALMKNIEKSFDHLDKKLSKIEKKTHQEQTNEDVTVKAEQQPVASIVPSAVPSAAPSSVPSPVITQVRNDSVSVKEKQEDSGEEKADHTKKNKDNKEDNRSEQEKEKKNNSGNDGAEKENGKGHDKNKGNKQE